MCWKWLEWPEMTEYSWALLEMGRTGWEWLEIAGMTGNGWKGLEMAKTGWNWLEMEGTAGNGWKLIKMTMMMLENQMGWPFHSFHCVLFCDVVTFKQELEIKYHMSGFTCHLSHVSNTTATATDSPIRDWLLCKDEKIKSTLFFGQFKASSKPKI